VEGSPASRLASAMLHAQLLMNCEWGRTSKHSKVALHDLFLPLNAYLPLSFGVRFLLLCPLAVPALSLFSPLDFFGKAFLMAPLLILHGFRSATLRK
jgi:hypothetical protein